MQEQQIVEMLYDRSERALDALEQQYGAAVARLAENILRSRRDAEEVENDTWLAVWNTIPPENPASLTGYIMRLARNIAVKRYHGNTARKRNSFYDAALDELAECVADRETVESICSARELAAEIDDFLGTLTAQDRVMFVRRYWFSDSVKDIAAMSGVTANRVSVRLFRMRERLRWQLMQKGVAV